MAKCVECKTRQAPPGYAACEMCHLGEFYNRDKEEPPMSEGSDVATCYVEICKTEDYWELNIKSEIDDKQMEFISANSFDDMILALKNIRDKLET